MALYRCSNCGQPYPQTGLPYRCPNCGGVFDLADEIVFNPKKVMQEMPRMWRYKHTFQLPINAPMITLGEGNTPLVSAPVFGQDVYFKLEYANPSGSFKDRGTAVLASYMLSRKVKAAIEDSSGNAGASFAAYAARAGIKAKVYVPDYASGPKRAQIEASGAELVRILGPRSATAEAVVKASEKDGLPYASHAYLPHGLVGIATIAYELGEQMDEPPGTVIAPVGHGSLLLGLARGFAALRRAGIIDAVPFLAGVQAHNCAPLWAVSQMGPDGLRLMGEGETLAEGVRVSRPLRGDALLKVMSGSGGQFVTVQEEEIIPGRDQLAQLGFYVEPTSAIVWNALAQVIETVPKPVAVILTGSGLKYQA